MRGHVVVVVAALSRDVEVFQDGEQVCESGAFVGVGMPALEHHLTI